MTHPDIRAETERLAANLGPEDMDDPTQHLDPQLYAERKLAAEIRLRQKTAEATEYHRIQIRARKEAERLETAAEAERAKNNTDDTGRVLDGAQFLFDIPDQIPAIWGKGDDIFWSRGEAMMICGPQGVGKTTIMGQLLRARIGLPVAEVFGFPVEPCTSRVLYLAMDRPEQARRNLARMFSPEEREYVQDLLRFWMGPPPEDVAVNPEVLLRLAERFGADTLIVDSVKDAAVGLSKDEVGAGYNRARQLALAEGIQIAESHHVVKVSQSGGPPNKLADIYGSTWITSGAGSVVMLWGEAGDPVVDLIHLKQPMNEIGPLKVVHNRESGLAEVFHDEDTDVVGLARRCSTTGLSAKEAAGCMYGKEKPTRAEVEKARRRLGQLVKAGLLVARPDVSAGQGGRGHGDRWFAAAPASWGDGGGGLDDRYR